MTWFHELYDAMPLSTWCVMLLYVVLFFKNLGETIALEELRRAVRKHRDYRGDDRCWMDDEELYDNLPEGYSPRKMDTCVELENCKRFLACRHHPQTEYVSSQRYIEKLEEEIRQLKEKPNERG